MIQNCNIECGLKRKIIDQLVAIAKITSQFQETAKSALITVRLMSWCQKHADKVIAAVLRMTNKHVLGIIIYQFVPSKTFVTMAPFLS